MNLPNFPNTPPAKHLAPGIVSMGVELEGEVFREEWDRLMDWAGRHCQRMADNGNDELDHQDGTVRTPHNGIPGELTFWSTDLRELERWIRLMYKEFKVMPNASCGFHIHVKPESKTKEEFFKKEYWDGFYRSYRKLAKEKESTSPKYAQRMHSDWCLMQRWSEDLVEEARSGYGGRFAINLNSLTYHGTVEHRIMPYQTTAEEAIEAVRWMAHTVSRLVTAREKAEKARKHWGELKAARSSRRVSNKHRKMMFQ
jgi:hypothetical protein